MDELHPIFGRISRQESNIASLRNGRFAEQMAEVFREIEEAKRRAREVEHLARPY